MHVTTSVALWPTLAVLVIATITDLRSRRIPNRLVVPFLAAGLVVSGLMHGWKGLGHSLVGVLIGAAFMGFFHYLGGMGMGDVKLCAAIGAWVGPSQMVAALLLTGVAGGVLAVCWAVSGGFFTETLLGIRALLLGFQKRGLRPHDTLVLDNPLARKMPYVPAIAIGTIFSFLCRG
jgi:prepilin peptidase CpaA